MVVQSSLWSGRKSRPVGCFAGVSVAVLAAVLVSACANIESLDQKAQLKSGDPAAKVAAMPADGEAERDPKSALTYARSLKKAGRMKDAYQVLETASDAAADNRPLLVERGLMALELGQMAQAQALLSRSNDLQGKDWRVLSGLGVAASSQGKQKDAQKYFKSALEASPDNPAVLNNLAVSYLLERKVEQAETMLRRAGKAKSGDAKTGDAKTGDAKASEHKARVTQNLTLAAAIKAERRDADEQTVVMGSGEPLRPVDTSPMGLTGGGLVPARVVVGGELAR